LTRESSIKYAQSVPVDGEPLAYLQIPVPRPSEHIRFTGGSSEDNYSGLVDQDNAPSQGVVTSIQDSLVDNGSFVTNTYSNTSLWIPGYVASSNMLECPGGECTTDDINFPPWVTSATVSSIGTTHSGSKNITASAYNGDSGVVARMRQAVDAPFTGPITLSFWGKYYSDASYYARFKPILKYLTTDTTSPISAQTYETEDYGMQFPAQYAHDWNTEIATWEEFTFTWVPSTRRFNRYLLLDLFTYGDDDNSPDSKISYDDFSLTQNVATTQLYTNWTAASSGSIPFFADDSASDSSNLITPFFHNDRISSSGSATLISDNFSVDNSTDYALMIDVYSDYLLTSATSWYTSATDPSDVSFSPNPYLRIRLTSVPTGETPVDVLADETSLPSSFTLVASDSKFPGKYKYKFISSVVQFSNPSSTTARVEIEWAYTNEVGVSNIQFGTPVFSGSEEEVTVPRRLQSPIEIHGVYSDSTDAWCLRIKNGVFQRRWTLDGIEPSTSWLREAGFDNGDDLSLVYALPEFDLQPAEDAENHYIKVYKEPCAVIDNYTILFLRRPVISVSEVLVNGSSVSGTLDVDNGKYLLSNPISLDDRVEATFTYREDYYIYRGFYDDGVWYDIDLNPALGHVYHLGVPPPEAEEEDPDIPIPATSIKGATEFSVTSGASDWNYACLNGDMMTVYVDRYGELGVRPVISFIPGAKNPGIGDPDTGFPDPLNITTDGQIAPTSNPPSYGLLRSLESRNDQASTELAIEGRKELLSLGTGTTVDCWGVRAAHADLTAPGDNYYISTDAEVTDFTVSGANAGVALSATSTVKYYDSSVSDLLEVKHIFSFQNDNSFLERVRVKVRVEFTNLSVDPLTDVRYVHGIDPNPGVTSGVTYNHFFVGSDLDAFAVNAVTGDDGIGIGGYTEGTLVCYTTEIRDGVITSSADDIIAGVPNIRLGSGTNAEYYSGNTLVSSTTNWKTDLDWRSSLPDVGGDYGLLLRSPYFDIEPSETAVFEYYYYTRGAQDAEEEDEACISNTSSDLVGSGVTLYLVPTAAYLADDETPTVESALSLPVDVRPKSFLRHRIGVDEETSILSDYPSAVIIGEVHVLCPGGVGGIRNLDLRERGGGLPEEFNVSSTEYSWRSHLQVDTSLSTWTRTWLNLQGGDRVRLVYDGIIDTSISGSLLPADYLIESLITDSYPSAGTSGTAIEYGEEFVVPSSGTLYLRFDDTDVGTGEGSAYVTIEVTRIRSKTSPWDVIGWDGNPAAIYGVGVVEVNKDVLTGDDGGPVVTREDVEQSVRRHIAAGIHPVIRFVDDS
jgi:hypothetical protein